MLKKKYIKCVNSLNRGSRVLKIPLWHIWHFFSKTEIMKIQQCLSERRQQITQNDVHSQN